MGSRNEFNMGKNLEHRLFSKVSPCPNSGCWFWCGAINQSGYGLVRGVYKNEAAHRVVYKMVTGSELEDMELHHKCKNRGCVNPSHLQEITPKKHREMHLQTYPKKLKKHCRNGHDFGVTNTQIHTNNKYVTRRCAICRRASQKRWYNSNRPISPT